MRLIVIKQSISQSLKLKFIMWPTIFGAKLDFELCFSFELLMVSYLKLARLIVDNKPKLDFELCFSFELLMVSY